MRPRTATEPTPVRQASKSLGCETIAKYFIMRPRTHARPGSQVKAWGARLSLSTLSCAREPTPVRVANACQARLTLPPVDQPLIPARSRATVTTSELGRELVEVRSTPTQPPNKSHVRGNPNIQLHRAWQEDVGSTCQTDQRLCKSFITASAANVKSRHKEPLDNTATALRSDQKTAEQSGFLALLFCVLSIGCGTAVTVCTTEQEPNLADISGGDTEAQPEQSDNHSPCANVADDAQDQDQEDMLLESLSIQDGPEGSGGLGLSWWAEAFTVIGACLSSGDDPVTVEARAGTNPDSPRGTDKLRRPATRCDWVSSEVELRFPAPQKLPASCHLLQFPLDPFRGAFRDCIGWVGGTWPPCFNVPGEKKKRWRPGAQWLVGTDCRSRGGCLFQEEDLEEGPVEEPQFVCKTVRLLSAHKHVPHVTAASRAAVVRGGASSSETNLLLFFSPVCLLAVQIRLVYCTDGLCVSAAVCWSAESMPGRRNGVAVQEPSGDQLQAGGGGVGRRGRRPSGVKFSAPVMFQESVQSGDFRGIVEAGALLRRKSVDVQEASRKRVRQLSPPGVEGVDTQLGKEQAVTSGARLRHNDFESIMRESLAFCSFRHLCGRINPTFCACDGPCRHCLSSVSICSTSTELGTLVSLGPTLVLVARPGALLTAVNYRTPPNLVRC
ncbi:hypothetical protein Bbelb_167980 [Branchiostoma belcheri]|nr:hypothetical protein Bbelb_167980 [Branchiostoma belcheri]